MQRIAHPIVCRAVLRVEASPLQDDLAVHLPFLGLWDPGAGEVRNSDVFAGLSTLQLYVGPRVEAKRKPGLRVICAGMVHASRVSGCSNFLVCGPSG